MEEAKSFPKKMGLLRMAFILASESKTDQGKQWFLFIIPDLDSCPNLSLKLNSHFTEGEEDILLSS